MRGAKEGNQNASKGVLRSERLNLRLDPGTVQKLKEIANQQGLKTVADAVIWLAANAE